ncbi:MAG: uracil phosphoribosyltransferase [Bacteroidota bacterium]
MVHILCETPSAANRFVAELRDVNIQSDRHRFRFNLERLGAVMAYEISKVLPHVEKEVQTPLGISRQLVADKPPVLIAVLRAALPYLGGFHQVFDASDTGFIGAYRVEGTGELRIQVDYAAIPDLNGRDVILIDPMLATGKSLNDAVALLKKKGSWRSLHLAALIASKQGLDAVTAAFGDSADIWTFAVDPELNAHAYIVPGLGDAGDLSFGEKR